MVVRRSQSMAPSLPPGAVAVWVDFIQNMMVPETALKSVWAGMVIWELLAVLALAMNWSEPRRRRGEGAASVAAGMKSVVLPVLVPLRALPEESLARVAAESGLSRSFRLVAATMVGVPEMPAPSEPEDHEESSKGSAAPRHEVPRASPPLVVVGTKALAGALAGTSGEVLRESP